VLGDLGVRFNYHTRYVIPYASVLAGVTFIRYKAEWEVGNEKRSEEEHSHGFGGAAIVGVDFFVHDNFTVGLAGRGGYFTSNLEYTNRDVRGETVPAYGYLAGCLRLAIVF
jgi:opacity protein-like surface antigen